MADCEIFPIDESTFILSHFDENGNEVSKEFDVSDPLSPLDFKQYMTTNSIDHCDFHIDDDIDWHSDMMEKFMIHATELFKFNDYIIESMYMN